MRSWLSEVTVQREDLYSHGNTSTYTSLNETIHFNKISETLKKLLYFQVEYKHSVITYCFWLWKSTKIGPIKKVN